MRAEMWLFIVLVSQLVVLTHQAGFWNVQPTTIFTPPAPAIDYTPFYAHVDNNNCAICKYMGPDSCGEFG